MKIHEVTDLRSAIRIAGLRKLRAAPEEAAS
jgi:DNA repair protein RadA/Sms